MAYNVVTMEKVNIRELKARLSDFIQRVADGETIVVAKRNEPIAEIHPIARRARVRLFGKPVKGLHVPSTFFDPLPEEFVSAFTGEPRR